MQRNTYFDYSPPLILPNIKGHIDYYPFGSAINARSYSSGAYRYGFNGKELDKESFTDAYDFGARIYDGRLGRFLSIDPKYYIFTWQSTYVFASNSPIRYIDENGENPGDQVKKGEGPAAYAKRNGTNLHQLAINNPTKFKNYPANGTLAEQDAYWKDNSGKNWQIHPGERLELGNNNSKKPIENNKCKVKTVEKKSSPDEVMVLVQEKKLVTKTKVIEVKETSNKFAGALVISGGLVADDATIVGVVDDILIPFIIGGALIYDATHNKTVLKTITYTETLITSTYILFKKLSENAAADAWAQKQGYENAHDLKDAYGVGSDMDIYVDGKTGKGQLRTKDGKKVIDID